MSTRDHLDQSWRHVMRKKPIEIDWQWPGWVPKGSLVTVYGDGETAKSFVMLAAAVSIASGMPLFDGAPTTGAPVLYLSHNENPFEENARRLQALTHGNQIRYVGAQDALRLIEAERPLLGEGFPDLRALIARYEPKTIILDSYATHSGLPAKGANDPDTVQALLNRTVLPLARQHGITVYGLAHTSRGNDSRPRGATTWFNAADACVAVSVRRAAGHARTTLTHRKGRSGGKDDRPVWIEFHDLNPEKTSIAVRSGREGVHAATEQVIPKKLRGLVRFIGEKDGPVSTEHVVRYLKSASRATVERLLAEAIALNLIVRPERGQYALPDAPAPTSPF